MGGRRISLAKRNHCRARQRADFAVDTGRLADTTLVEPQDREAHRRPARGESFHLLPRHAAGSVAGDYREKWTGTLWYI